jgi:tRNA-modifying protein YgfZ
MGEPAISEPTQGQTTLPASTSDLWVCFDVRGKDAAAFLHAQFTNEINAMAVGDARLNGWASPKGRLLFSMWVIRREEGYRIFVLGNRAEALRKRLGMFILRSAVTLSTPDAVCLLASHNAQEIRSALAKSPSVAEAEVVALSGDRSIVTCAQAEQARIAEVLRAGGISLDTSAWALASVRAGEPQIEQAVADLFVPQMVNFELIGGVSFKKGCYPGQEIVARTQYLGKLKRRMALVHTPVGLAPGMDLHSPQYGEQAIGQVVNVAIDGVRHYALVSCLIDAWSGGVFAAGQQVERVNLPYSVPELPVLEAFRGEKT